LRQNQASDPGLTPPIQAKTCSIVFRHPEEAVVKVLGYEDLLQLLSSSKEIAFPFLSFNWVDRVNDRLQRLADLRHLHLDHQQPLLCSCNK
jgi:hypothetical protein